MNVLSVCSGIGAPECAWAPLGFSFVAQSEIEAFPSAVLAHHFPGAPNWGDMTKFKEWPDADVDVLVGGTPCQSFSVAGLRKGLADPRGNLALTYLAIADKYRPQWLVWENVPGVLSSGDGRDFGSFLGALVQLGYGFVYRVLDAQFFGVAQRRRRVFVVANLGDWRRAAAVLFERESLSGDPAPRRCKGEEVAGTFTSRARSGGWSHDVDLAASGYMVPTISNALTRRDHKGQGSGRDQGAPLIPVLAHALRGEGFDASEDGTGRGTPWGPVAAPVMSDGKRMPGTQPDDATSLIPIAYRTSGNCGAWETGDKTDALTTGTDPNSHVIATLAIRGRGDDSNFEYRTDGTANALLTPNGGRAGIGVGAIQTGMQVRRLTPTECERLQGFPDGWTAIEHRGKPAADGPRYKALGNSMAVPVLRWIGERIMRLGQMSDETK